MNTKLHWKVYENIGQGVINTSRKITINGLSEDIAEILKLLYENRMINDEDWTVNKEGLGWVSVIIKKK